MANKFPPIELPATHGAVRKRINDNFAAISEEVVDIKAKADRAVHQIDTYATPTMVALSVVSNVPSLGAQSITIDPATTEMAGVMTAEDKKKLETLHRPATPNKDGLMSKKDKKRLDRLGPIPHKVIVGRAIPMKARKGSQYFFADGVIKYKIREKDLTEFPELREYLEDYLEQRKDPEFEPSDGDIVWDGKWPTKDEPVIITRNTETLTPTLLGVVESPVISGASWWVEYGDDYDRGKKFLRRHIPTRSPYLYIENGRVGRTRPITRGEAIEAINRTSNTEHFESFEFRVRKRVKRNRSKEDSPHRKPSNRWVRYKSLYNKENLPRLKGAKIRVYKKVRGSACSEFVELYIRLDKSKRRYAVYNS